MIVPGLFNWCQPDFFVPEQMLKIRMHFPKEKCLHWKKCHIRTSCLLSCSHSHLCSLADNFCLHCFMKFIRQQNRQLSTVTCSSITMFDNLHVPTEVMLFAKDSYTVDAGAVCGQSPTAIRTDRYASRISFLLLIMFGATYTCESSI